MRRTVEQLRLMAKETAIQLPNPRTVDPGEWYADSPGVAVDRYGDEKDPLTQWRVATCPQAIIELCDAVDDARRLLDEVQQQLSAQFLEAQETLSDVAVELRDRDVTIMADGKDPLLNLLRRVLRERASNLHAVVGETRLCARCDGAGNVMYVEGTRDPQTRMSVPVLCPLCKGSGVAP